jgi:hypothetical protein
VLPVQQAACSLHAHHRRVHAVCTAAAAAESSCAQACCAPMLLLLLLLLLLLCRCNSSERLCEQQLQLLRTGSADLRAATTTYNCAHLHTVMSCTANKLVVVTALLLTDAASVACVIQCICTCAHASTSHARAHTVSCTHTAHCVRVHVLHLEPPKTPHA